MDQGESFAEFGHSRDIDGEETGRLDPSLDIRGHARNDSAGASDGDGAMLGRVLIYASIIAVGVVALVWKRFS